MKRTQAMPVVAALLAVLAGASAANVTSSTPPSSMRTLDMPIDVSAIPSECTEFLAIPHDTSSPLYAWQQRLSVAACRQSVAISPVTEVQQLGAMVATIERAMAPSQVIYRDAAARGPNQIRILANYGLGMTYTETIVRARRALAPSDQFGGATYGHITLDRASKLRLALEPLLAADRDGALSAYDEVARLAADDPAAASANVVTERAVADARAQAAMLR